MALEGVLQRPQLQRRHGEVAWMMHLGLLEKLSSWMSPGVSASCPHIWIHWSPAELQRAQQLSASVSPSFAVPLHTCVVLSLYLRKLIGKKGKWIDRWWIGKMGRWWIGKWVGGG